MVEFIAGIGVGAGLLLLLRRRSRAPTLLGSTGAQQELIARQQHSNAPPTSSEATRLEQQVAKRLERATELRLPELVTALVKEIPYWPSWINHESTRRRILSVVRSAEKIDDRTRLDVDGSLIDISFKSHGSVMPDGEYVHFGNAEVLWNDRRVFSLSLQGTEEDDVTSWRPSEVTAFIEGPWIEVLTRLSEKHRDALVEEQRLKREAPERLEAMKKDFGIT